MKLSLGCVPGRGGNCPEARHWFALAAPGLAGAEAAPGGSGSARVNARLPVQYPCEVIKAFTDLRNGSIHSLVP